MVTHVAVLDDYHGLAPTHFSKLDPSQYSIKYFPQTLRPYHDGHTSQAEKDELVRRLEPFDVIATMRERTPFPKELIDRLPQLKLILSNGRHNKAIDMQACHARGVPVTGSDVSKATVATLEHIITMILAVCRDIAQNDAAVKSGKWQTSMVTGVTGKTLGIVGLGRLGSSVARIMSTAFNMKIICWSSNLTQNTADEQAKAQGLPVERPDGEKTFKCVSREELFSSSDIVTLHLLLSDRTRGLITIDDLSRMKQSSFFVNTSRGPLVVEDDLLGILKAGKIRGAALEVFNLEPLPADSEWRDASWGTGGKSQVLVTPHIAFVEEGVLNDFYEHQVAELERWTKGEALGTTMS
ncbi:d-isomer specific 2-hydroxyacid dehydrogenase [Fusarium longipes]|uniref:D-isomer specific 2-hydroxyacid dehydrogenase n=1 Tax=Fusarium longipes TaxID=694270 RepID=A0A395SA43_9HYPO|nr:d-isomer specific 2-hydroxyacid dehydrogenase [Fusarium longipes]